MQAYKSSANLKMMAKGQLLGKYPTAVSAFLAVGCINIIIRLLSNLLIDERTIFGILVSYLITFIITLLLGVINVGCTFMALKITCNEPISVADIFFGFNYNPNKIIYIQAVLGIVNLIATLPFTIVSSLFLRTNQMAYFLAAAVLLIAGMAIYYYVSLVLSQAIFLLLDFEQQEPRELLKMSALLMKGHKGRLFYIYISFIPLILLGLLTCCIGYIWILPYIRVTLANFYMDLMHNKHQ